MPQSIRVLLVEDSPSDAALLTEWLLADQKFEYALTVAESLGKAVTLLHEKPFDVVLVDLGLSDSTGLETLRVVAGVRVPVPIIVLTGLDDEEVGFRAVESGAQDFLTKNHCDSNLLRRSIRYSIERNRLDRERVSLNKQLVTVLEDEKQRIARELHDEVGQGLSGLNMMFRSLVLRLRELGMPELSKATMISDGIQETLDSFRRVLCGLSPVGLDVYGLKVALQRFCDDVNLKAENITCQLIGDEGVSVSDNNIANQLYRVAQESIANAWKHAQAGTINVSLCCRDDCVVMQIIDDGVGFDVDAQHDGMGLRILRHRSEMIGGRLTIESGSNGTQVTIKVDIENGTAL